MTDAFLAEMLFNTQHSTRMHPKAEVTLRWTVYFKEK
jgi:hypothetical protein